jgi:predicted DsbA family dithiol-disulfide isomerase
VREVVPGTIALYSDLGCPWAHLAVFRLHRTRRRLGLDVAIDHRPFVLELMNGRPTPKPVLEAELPVAGALDPDAGWQVWQAPAWQWPVSTLLPLEAVQATKAQGLAASEQLDRALRVAFFGQSRCISMHHVVLDVARACDLVDVDRLAQALGDGDGRAAVLAPPPEAVAGSPHLFLPDGTDAPNPGIELHWEGEHGRGFPVIDADDAEVYEDHVRRAAA